MGYNKYILSQLQENIQKIIVGKEKVIRLILLALIGRGHVLIEDVPGVGKTTMVSSLARSLDLSFKRVQFTPDILPSDITGFSMYNTKTGDMEYRPGLIMGHIVLADEINRTSPKTQSSLLEVMEESQVTVDGNTYPLPRPFMVLATQNPVEYVGTFPLPEAQLDRFFLKISIGYPSMREEIDILSRFTYDISPDILEPVATDEDIIGLQDRVMDIRVADQIKEYIAQIVDRTRHHKDIALGVSPRGAIFLMRAAQAQALLEHRDYVIPDDVQYMIEPVLAHRIILKPETRLQDLTPELILKSIVKEIYVPVIRG
ncbi:MAG: MoxR family ATPase [Clostridiales bacterium]|nr:MoxR family ATPase [Clostridiales bacterium]